ncbi:MAG: class II SORL domain-containing protein [Chloroflexi bacterium]|nr:class II SORL domain-containing protein [Chloroflexota bacterium]MBU1746138.1 class II SORL domain-containing protein [Chloroflexota bacterium]MBU1878341.1 class II SORL domain-containing protein [Chloroflexota bacterium]
MSKLTELVQTADWKLEKHAPVIECASVAPAGEPFEVLVSVGKEIPHPNTLEHHIAWIDLYFQPEGAKFPIHVGHFAFNAHGESETFTHPAARSTLKLTKPGVLYALSMCNIHGLWESSMTIALA